jgi:protein SCO1/2
MRVLILTLAAIVACGRPHEAKAPPAEKTYTMKGTLVSRNSAKNQVTIDHEEVPEVMSAMTMDYELRGAKVSSLPPDGTKITSKLHEQGGKFWVTDVMAIAPPK